jgi:hypothetical protein
MHQRFGEKYCLILQCRVFEATVQFFGFCNFDILAQKMETFSETSVSASQHGVPTHNNNIDIELMYRTFLSNSYISNYNCIKILNAGRMKFVAYERETQRILFLDYDVATAAVVWHYSG